MYARRYAQAQNETASPERRMVLLFEAAQRHIHHGIAALEEGRPGGANAPLSRAAEIVMALHDTLDPARSPALAERLPALYRFVCDRLVSGNAQHDAALVREADAAFTPIADAFAEAVRQAPARVAP